MKRLRVGFMTRLANNKPERIIFCSQCNENNEIVAFEVLKISSKLDVLLPICQMCVEIINRKRA
jgi:hypothetical protein